MEKTAMQELIEWMEKPSMTDKEHISIKKKAKQLLEKERQQIIDAHNIGWEGEYNDGESYYQQTFNQHID